MQLGFSRESIYPMLSKKLGGYAVENRHSEGILDEVFVRTIILEWHEYTFVLINYDLVGVDSLLMTPIEAYIESLGIPKEHLIITATHTHSSIGGLLNTEKGILQASQDIFMETDLVLRDWVLEYTKSSIDEAIENLGKGEIEVAKGQLLGVGTNRNNQNLKGNDNLFVVKLTNHIGTVVLVNYACHPTVLGPDNKYVSADFPGAISKYLEEEGYLFSCFLNGAAGDISTRYTKQAATFEEVLRIGRLFVDKINQLTFQTVQINQLDIWKTSHLLAIKEYLPILLGKQAITRCEQEITKFKRQSYYPEDLRKLTAKLEGAICNYHLSLYPLEVNHYEVSVQYLKINNHIFVIIPGELYSELGNQIQTDTIHIIGYANDYLGYFANEEAYELDYYEANSSHFKKGSSEKLISNIIQVLKEKGEIK